MDMSGGSRIRERFVNATHGYNYLYERVYTLASAHANHDPFVPRSPIGYASVSSATTNWVGVSSAVKVHHIALTAWSTKAVADWKLSTKVMAWKGFANSPPTVDRCSAALSRTTVNNGVHLTLTVTYTGLPTTHYWCAITIRSGTPDMVNNDKFRQWLVGLRFSP
jgi:hypothetical protein